MLSSSILGNTGKLLFSSNRKKKIMSLKERKEHFYRCERKAEFCGGDARTLRPGREVRGVWKGAGSSFPTSPVCVALRQQTEETTPEPTTPGFKTLTSVCCDLDFFCFVSVCFVFLWHIDRCTGGHTTQHTQVK